MFISDENLEIATKKHWGLMSFNVILNEVILIDENTSKRNAFLEVRGTRMQPCLESKSIFDIHPI